MNIDLIFPAFIHQAAMHHFVGSSSDEQFGFFLAGINRYEDRTRLLIREFIPAQKEDLMRQSGVCVRPKPEFTRRVWRECREKNAVIVTGHCHPFSDEGVSFSGIDDASDRESFPLAVEYLGSGPHTSLVFGRQSMDARWYEAESGRVYPVAEVRVLGDTLQQHIPTSYSRAGASKGHALPFESEVVCRQVRALGSEGQAKISKLKVGVVGVGGLGSITSELLVRLGVRMLVIVDPDLVETSNLNRLFGSRPEDAQNRVPKVRMMARYLRQISPNVEITPIQNTLLSEPARAALKTCDVLFGCTDTSSSRVELNRLSTEYLIPCFDTGTGINAKGEGRIIDAGGQVRVVIPGEGCLSCIGGLDMEAARNEALPSALRQIAIQRGYISGADVPAPAVASLNTAVASLAVTEFMAFVTRFKPLKRYVRYDFLKSTAVVEEFARRQDCLVCGQGGLLGIGDLAISAKRETKFTVQERKGVTAMKEKKADQKSNVMAIVSGLRKRGFECDGDGEGGWFSVKGIPLGEAWSMKLTEVVVKFEEDGESPVILVPSNLSLKGGGHVCERFLESHTYLKGCRRLCPHMIEEAGDLTVELVVFVVGLLVSPSLCGACGCLIADKVVQLEPKHEVWA